MAISNELLSIIVKLIISGAFSAVTAFLIPILKQNGIYTKVKYCVFAAEKLGATGAISSNTKKEYAIKALKAMGVDVNESVEVMIEAAVQELDNQSTKLVEEMKKE